MPRVIEPPGPSDRDELARLRGDHLRSVIKAVTTLKPEHAADAHELALQRAATLCPSLLKRRDADT